MVIKSSIRVCPPAGGAVNWAVSLPSMALLYFCCVLLTALAGSQQKCINHTSCYCSHRMLTGAQGWESIKFILPVSKRHCRWNWLPLFELGWVCSGDISSSFGYCCTLSWALEALPTTFLSSVQMSTQWKKRVISLLLGNVLTRTSWKGCVGPGDSLRTERGLCGVWGQS